MYEVKIVKFNFYSHYLISRKLFIADILLFTVLHLKPRTNMHLRLFNFQYFGLNAFAYILREVHIGS